MSDQKQQSENNLHEIKTRLSRLEDLIENAADAILIGDDRGCITYANRAADDLIGCEGSELIGLNISKLFCETDLQQRPLRYDLLHHGLTIKNERLIRRKDGTKVAVEMNSRRLSDGTCHTFIRDISERKKIEAALRLSEEKFSRAFMHSPDAININRLSDGSYIAINQGFTRAMGWTEEEVLGHSSLPGDLDIWCHPEDRERLLAGLEKTGEVDDFEASFCSKDGRTIIGLMSARVLEINSETCILSITRDISERVKTQEKQRKLESQFLQAQKLESLGVLAGGIAHDFNNILLSIIGNTELALRRLKSESPAVGYLQKVQLSTTRAADLAKQMLAYSGKGKFVVETLDLNNMIEEMFHLLEVSISKKAVLRLNPHHPLPSIAADATQIRQIIMNLIINASEAIGDQSGVIAMTTGCMDCDQDYLNDVWLEDNLNAGLYVYVEISDSGSGMDKEMVSKVFDPFFSTKFTGRGLGLAAVLGIVRGHKGAIKVYSEPGKGTTFKILIPATDKPAELFSGIPQENDWHGHGTVLLVDDEVTIRDIGAEMLQELGLDTITAQDGRDAVKIFEHNPGVSLVILDLTMPHMDGEQCFRELRRINPDVKVIMSSGYNESEVTQKFVAKGLAGFIQKPYNISALKEVVRSVMGR